MAHASTHTHTSAQLQLLLPTAGEDMNKFLFFNVILDWNQKRKSCPILCIGCSTRSLPLLSSLPPFNSKLLSVNNFVCFTLETCWIVVEKSSQALLWLQSRLKKAILKRGSRERNSGDCQYMAEHITIGKVRVLLSRWRRKGVNLSCKATRIFFGISFDRMFEIYVARPRSSSYLE